MGWPSPKDMTLHRGVVTHDGTLPYVPSHLVTPLHWLTVEVAISECCNCQDERQAPRYVFLENPRICDITALLTGKCDVRGLPPFPTFWNLYIKFRNPLRYLNSICRTPSPLLLLPNQPSLVCVSSVPGLAQLGVPDRST